MSLNRGEIDRVLGDFPQEPVYVHSIYSQGFFRYFINLEGTSGPWCLFVCLESPYLRLSIFPRHHVQKCKPHRFLSSLRKLLIGVKLNHPDHYLQERIIRLVFRVEGREQNLWIRLWTGAANMFLTDENGQIQDAAFLRPKRGEVVGQVLKLPHESKPHEFTVRDFGQGGQSYSEAVERFYRQLEQESQLQKSIERYRGWLEGQINSLVHRIRLLEEQQDNLGERDQHLGDLVMANLYLFHQKKDEVSLTDWDGKEILLKVDPSLSGVQIAQDFYLRARKARERAQRSQEELALTRQRLAYLQKELERLITEPGAWVIQAVRQISQWKEQAQETQVGLRLTLAQFPVLIGRNAKENDLLLRTAAKGRDHWLHTRDYPGGYVFIRSPVNKTVPLPVLLDAAQLAAYFSKARGKGKIDVFWTQVKYLRRVKKGKLGKVIPTQEKNLTIETDPMRVRKLLGISSHD
jgi:predicted ribosome quality control (RQC) complex YloA/Tae2 family protein